ncbi:hypothetical protein [Lactiplantibacillus carotarum]|uniref:hypothetical protein n=1 Tax=Lactiplantibacillus carotarum TaxID=2993456 RepID=UPI00298ED315|nr:hypothetical protein [Lactiplantibacillus carotarum]
MKINDIFLTGAIIVFLLYTVLVRVIVHFAKSRKPKPTIEEILFRNDVESVGDLDRCINDLKDVSKESQNKSKLSKISGLGEKVLIGVLTGLLVKILYTDKKQILVYIMTFIVVVIPSIWLGKLILDKDINKMLNNEQEKDIIFINLLKNTRDRWNDRDKVMQKSSQDKMLEAIFDLNQTLQSIDDKLSKINKTSQKEHVDVKVHVFFTTQF